MHFYERVATLLFTTKLNFSRGKILVEYTFLWGRYLTNFPMVKSIHNWQLPLNSVELPEKSMAFKNIGNFLRNRHLCEISLRIPKQSKKYYNSRTIKNFKILIESWNSPKKSCTFFLLHKTRFYVWLSRSSWASAQGSSFWCQNLGIITEHSKTKLLFSLIVKHRVGLETLVCI